jgi:hypothetical protein
MLDAEIPLPTRSDIVSEPAQPCRATRFASSRGSRAAEDGNSRAAVRTASSVVSSGASSSSCAAKRAIQLGSERVAGRCMIRAHAIWVPATSRGAACGRRCSRCLVSPSRRRRAPHLGVRSLGQTIFVSLLPARRMLRLPLLFEGQACQPILQPRPPLS